jgi:hypothetical protein
VCYLIGHGLFNTVFHQSPLEGVCKLHPLIEIESQHANFTVEAIQDALQSSAGVFGPSLFGATDRS